MSHDNKSQYTNSFDQPKSIIDMGFLFNSKSIALFKEKVILEEKIK